jgi:hypothetical protein
MVPAGSAHLSQRSEQPLVVPGDVVVGRVEGRQLLDEFAIRDKRVFETDPLGQDVIDRFAERGHWDGPHGMTTTPAQK